MSPKSIALIAAAIAVLGLGVYLFVQVRSTPAQASAPSPSPSSVATRSEAPTTSPTASPVPDAQPVQKPSVFRPDMPGPQGSQADDQHPNVKADATMDQANKAYDHGEYDDATSIAGKLLAKDPTNVRMLRIMVSAACIQGDSNVAQQYYEKLPKVDREQMRTRCDRYGVTFKEPAQ